MRATVPANSVYSVSDTIWRREGSIYNFESGTSFWADAHVYYLSQMWLVGPDATSTSAYAVTYEGSIMAVPASGWLYYDGTQWQGARAPCCTPCH